MPVKISRDHPVPTDRKIARGECHELRTTIALLKPGESFHWPRNKSVHRSAKEIGRAVVTRKLETGGYRVWLAPTRIDC